MEREKEREREREMTERDRRKSYTNPLPIIKVPVLRADHVHMSVYSISSIEEG